MPPKKNIKPIVNDEIINFYELDGCKPFQTEYHNPCYNGNTMPLKHCLQLVIVGCTGSGKTNILLNIINSMDDTFNYIKIFTQNKSEALYEYIESRIPKPYLEIFEGIDKFNKMNFDKLDKGQYLFIYDDFCIESSSKQKNIEEMYTRGRKLGEKGGISNIYLTQSWYDTPKVIRKQCGYIILKKVNGKLEINSILRDCSIANMTSSTLQNMYDYCVKSKEDIVNFLLIDKTAKNKDFVRISVKF